MDRSAPALNDAEASHELGVRLFNANKFEDAAEAFRASIAANPGSGKAHHNLGVTLRLLQRYDDALDNFNRALQLNHWSALTFHNAGLALRSLARRDEAIGAFQRALAMKPDYTEAANALGVTLADGKRREEAIAVFTRALQIDPEYALARAQRMHQQALLCDWGAVGADAPSIAALGIDGAAVPPFSLLAIEDHPARHHLRAERFAQERLAQQQRSTATPAARRPSRLRVGYFSADFHEHAVMRLIVRLLELHDRERFEVHAFSFGPDGDDTLRPRLRAGVDRFHDVRSMTDTEIVAFARGEAIDIAVDLSGYSQGARSGVFARGVAPIQINYLGYPGTMGADFMDYIVADAVLIPADQRVHYAEHVIYLPHSYQANDDQRAVATRTPERSEEGLPAQGFVFCCFNNSYKITPAEFDIWMRLLGQIDGSVLWLLKPDQRTIENLRSEAQKRGVDPTRLVFAERRAPAQHLARQRLADLFLDTFNYNAHTTASDALWAGVPLVTKLGQGFAARVAGSLLNAIGLPELITENNGNYEALALALALKPGQLRSIRSRLEAQRASAPLFDSALYAKHIEDGYDQAYQRYVDGKRPSTIVIRP